VRQVVLVVLKVALPVEELVVHLLLLVEEGPVLITN
jgi:hypothetical protein